MLYVYAGMVSLATSGDRELGHDPNFRCRGRVLFDFSATPKSNE